MILRLHITADYNSSHVIISLRLIYSYSLVREARKEAVMQHKSEYDIGDIHSDTSFENIVPSKAGLQKLGIPNLDRRISLIDIQNRFQVFINCVYYDILDTDYPAQS